MNTPGENERISKTAMEILSVLHTGKTMDEIFDAIFAELKKIIPYDRIGLSLITDDGKITEHKVKSDAPIELGKGYSCQLSYTTLGTVLSGSGEIVEKYSHTIVGKRRVIHDLAEYVREKGRVTPYNQQLLHEGVRSSLAIPLFLGGKPAGFLFFSSRRPNVYTREHLCGDYDVCMHLLEAIRPHLALAVDKGVTITTLRETNQKLNELLKMKDDFLSIASHDLRSPLTTIIGYCRFVAGKTEMTEAQRKMVDAIGNSAGHLLLLVDDMLTLAKANAGEMSLNLQNSAPGDVLEQSILAMAFNAHNKRVEIKHFRAARREGLLDSSKMFQVFNNLIGNAIKFSYADGEIEIRETLTDDQYFFSVRDNGPGISEDDQKKLFGRFVQVGDDAAKKHMGTGLGLMICRMMVEKHGGKIWVESEIGKGATFSFTIPLGKTE
ncbi:MAG: GAF domain-containing sensor histidine kinase [Nitrospinae bacterium]|nr:GAF domain-containing sensor histidine kinase [Nitrospinota bacterium]